MLLDTTWTIAFAILATLHAADALITAAILATSVIPVITYLEVAVFLVPAIAVPVFIAAHLDIGAQVARMGTQCFHLNAYQIQTLRVTHPMQQMLRLF